MSARRLLSSLLLLIALGGCAVALPPPRQPVQEDARRLVDLLITRWHAFTDMRALADVVMDRGGQRQQLTGVVLARGPASIRFEALSPFGQPFLLVTVHDSTLSAYNAATNEVMVAPATAETTARLVGLPFDAEELAAVLSGHAVPPKDLRFAEVMPPDAFGASVLLIGGLNEQRIWMEVETGLVHQVQITGGRAAATVTYLREPDGTIAGFDLSAAERYVTGTVRYRSLQTGTGIDPSRFTLTLPKDAKTQTIR